MQEEKAIMLRKTISAHQASPGLPPWATGIARDSICHKISAGNIVSEQPEEARFPKLWGKLPSLLSTRFISRRIILKCLINEKVKTVRMDLFQEVCVQ